MAFIITELDNFLSQNYYNQFELLSVASSDFHFSIKLRNKPKIERVYTAIVPNIAMLLEYIDNEIEKRGNNSWSQDLCIAEYQYSSYPVTQFYPIEVEVTAISKEEHQKCLDENHNKYYCLKNKLK